MKTYWKNVFRLARQNKGSFLGAVFIIAIGIFIFVAMKDTLRNLKDQVDVYYEKNCLAQVFAEVAGISETELSDLRKIPGIAGVSGKMSRDVRLLARGQEEIVTVHLMSYDEEDALNKLELSVPFGEENRQEGLYLGARMSEVYGYEAGEPMTLLLEGETVTFTFLGVCHGPWGGNRFGSRKPCDGRKLWKRLLHGAFFPGPYLSYGRGRQFCSHKSGAGKERGTEGTASFGRTRDLDGGCRKGSEKL